MTTTSTISSSNTGAVSSLGIGSGLDVTSIISGLMKVEQQPLTDLQTQATSIQTTISAFGAVQSAVSAFRDAAATIALPSTWNATTGTSSDSSSVGVTTTSNAAAGNYSVAVTKLAAAQSTVSPTFATSSSLVGSGTLHIDLGTWNADQSAFTAQTSSTGTSTGTDIAVTSTDTLDTLAQKINSAAPGIGASVVNDATGARLVFTASTTGTANGFRVTAAGASGTPSLAALAFDPASGSSGTTQAQPAQNAVATINGVTVNSSTNTLSNVLNGLSVTLSKVTTASSPVQITVAQDQSGITTSMQAFVTAYNSLSTLMSTDLAYNASTQVAGPLQGDSAALSLQSQLRKIIGSPSGASSTFTTLSSVGLEVQKDGTLTLDSTKFTAALANPTELKKAFTAVDFTNANNDGFADQLRTFGDQVLGSTGVLTTRVAGLSTNLQNNQKDQDSLSDRLAQTQARLTAEYSALDSTMASSSALSAYVTQQITNWNKSTS